jgi:uncharacterized membrane protein
MITGNEFWNFLDETPELMKWFRSVFLPVDCD